jgi:hypothetical protein
MPDAGSGRQYLALLAVRGINREVDATQGARHAIHLALRLRRLLLEVSLLVRHVLFELRVSRVSSRSFEAKLHSHPLAVNRDCARRVQKNFQGFAGLSLRRDKAAQRSHQPNARRLHRRVLRLRKDVGDLWPRCAIAGVKRFTSRGLRTRVLIDRGILLCRARRLPQASLFAEALPYSP